MTVAQAHWGDDTAAPRVLGSAQVLDIWETLRGQSMTRRAIALLVAALPGMDRDRIESLPIGIRDRLLLKLRSACFGPAMECMGTCPDCGETVEFTLSIADLLASLGPEGAPERTVDWEEREIRLRPVTSRDLLSLEGTAPEDMVRLLLARCVTGLDDAGDALTADTASKLSQALADLDPGADFRLSLTCPDCGHGWDSPFDIASYLWAEIDMAARRLLPEVHVLASSYGWSEQAILALSPARRRSYLALLGAG